MKTKTNWCSCLMIVSLALFGNILREVTADVCVVGELRVCQVRGKVVATTSDGEVTLSHASVSLRKRESRAHILVQTTTDSEGGFEIPDVGPGRYVLEASYPPLVKLSVPVQVIRAKVAVDAKEIVLALGASGIQPCGGGYAVLRDLVEGAIDGYGEAPLGRSMKRANHRVSNQLQTRSHDRDSPASALATGCE